MPTDIGEAAMAALKSALEAIGNPLAAAAPWAQSDRPQVFRTRVQGQTLEARPCIGIGGYIERYVRDCIAGTAQRDFITVTVPIRAYFDAATWNPDVDASTWKHDLKKALRDHRLGGNVFDVEINTILVGPVDPEDPECRIAMEVTLKWHDSDQDPSVSIP